MKTATVNVKVVDLPEVKAAFERAAAKLEEAEATIQGLIAQGDAMARTITDLAFEAWHGTQRCADCRYCGLTYCGRCLQVIDALTRTGFGDHMREWAGA